MSKWRAPTSAEAAAVNAAVNDAPRVAHERDAALNANADLAEALAQARLRAAEILRERDRFEHLLEMNERLLGARQADIVELIRERDEARNRYVVEREVRARYEAALRKIVAEDWRGNEPNHIAIARAALDVEGGSDPAGVGVASPEIPGGPSPDEPGITEHEWRKRMAAEDDPGPIGTVDWRGRKRWDV